jgi:streptogramin lyase
MHDFRNLKLFMIAATFVVSATVVGNGQTSHSHSAEQPLLTGNVRSDTGEKMEGVIISAKMESQNITTSVYTDQTGTYYLPPATGKGNYRIWAQAEGFETAKGEVTLDVSSERHDFMLKPAKDFTKQLTGQEYLAAIPEDTLQHRRMKETFINNCTGCHEASYILQNRFDERGWEAVINLMSKLQNGGGNYGGPDQAPFPVINYYKQELAQFLAEMRGPGPSPMQIRAAERPKGEATLAVVTEYSLPRADSSTYASDTGYALNDGSDWSVGTPSRLNGVGGTHDAQIDFNGNIWFTYAQPSISRSVGMVDHKTGKVTDIRIESVHGMAAFTHGLTIDHNGILWSTAAGTGSLDGGVGSLARIDPNTLKVEIYTPPKGMSGVSLSLDEDGKGNIWASTESGALCFDPVKKQFTEFRSPIQVNSEGTGRSYGVTGDREGNGWWTQMYIDRVGKGDIKTMKAVDIRFPPHTEVADDGITAQDRQVYADSGIFMSDFSGLTSQGPRRLGADKQGDTVWVADYWGGNIAKIDIHTLKPTLYKYPKPYPGTYDAVVDSYHRVWTNLLNSDAFAKFDPKTESWIEYPLPSHGLEMRHIAVSNHNGPTQIILSYFRAGKVARVEFRTKEELQALRVRVKDSQGVPPTTNSGGN